MNSSAVLFYKATDFREMQRVVAGQHSALGNGEAREPLTVLPAGKLQFALLRSVCDHSYTIVSGEREYQTGNVAFWILTLRKRENKLRLIQ